MFSLIGTLLILFASFPFSDANSKVYHRLLTEEQLNSRLLSAISAGTFKDDALVEVKKLEVGIDSDNAAYVWFEDDNGYEFGYVGLEQTPSLHLHRLEHHGEAYRLIDDKHLISLLIHDYNNQDISLTIWTFNEDKSATPSFHLSPRALLRSKDVSVPGRRLLERSSASRFVAYDYTASFSQGYCGAVAVSDTTDELIKLDSQTESHQHRHSRVLPPSRVSNCFPDDTTPHVVDISFIADLGYFHSFESNVQAVQQSVEVIVSNVNLIYFFQFNVHVRLQQLAIVTSNIGQPATICSIATATSFSRTRDLFSASVEDDTCCVALSTTRSVMESFTRTTSSGRVSSSNAFVQVTSSSQLTSSLFVAAHWHWLTDCFPADCGEDICEVGQAPLLIGSVAKGLACDLSGRGYGMSSRTFQTWLVVAHELGHNFGGLDHSFEDGRGRTGGLMDYGDGKVNGIYSFNSIRNEQFCTSMTKYLEENTCIRNSINYFSTLVDGCDSADDFTREDACEGICVNQTCVPLQLLVKVNTRQDTTDPNLFEETILTEPAEFSPIDISDESDIVTGELEVASPLRACSAVQDLTGKIAVIERGDCLFKTKIQNLVAANAVGAIIFNSNGGAPKAVGGAGFINLPVVSISRNDGELLLEQMNSVANLQASVGGFAASDENLDFIPISFFEEYFIPIVSFIGIFGPIVVLWFAIRGRDEIALRMKAAAETVVDTAIDGKYHLINKFDSVRQSIRVSRAIDPEEIRQLRENQPSTVV